MSLCVSPVIDCSNLSMVYPACCPIPVEISKIFKSKMLTFTFLFCCTVVNDDFLFFFFDYSNEILHCATR